jgi:hypothetical protein
MNDHVEPTLAEALDAFAKALAERADALAEIREAIFESDLRDDFESEPSDEELERRADNRRAYRKPYDWMTELED